MLGFTITSQLKPSLPIPTSFPSSSSLKSQQFSLFLKPQQSLLVFAINNNNNNGHELKEKGNTVKEQPPTGSSNGKQQQPSQEDVDGKNSSKQRRPIFSFNLNSLLDPDPDNVLALGLTGLLTWASVQVLWQLLFISLAILLAALKYSFIAALLVFILITLL